MHQSREDRLGPDSRGEFRGDAESDFRWGGDELEDFLVGDCPEMGVEWAETLLRSLKDNATLKLLHCVFDGDDDRDEMFDRLTGEMKKLACNLSSFEALCASNHALNYVVMQIDDRQYEAPSSVALAFEINSRVASVNLKVRSKLQSSGRVRRGALRNHETGLDTERDGTLDEVG
ncbi:hypothetical protein ACHAXS_007432 [Conticribra weissflogii]